MDIQIIENKLSIKYYKSLRDQLQKNNIEYDWLTNHIEFLSKQVEEDKLSDTQTEKKKDNTNSSETENHKQIFSDEDLYKKPWSKLNSIHKILKIKEFVNSLKINKENDRAELRDELVMLIKTKVLSKKENIKYDEVNGKIIGIPKLQYKDGKYFYLTE